MSTTTTNVRVNELNDFIRTGRILEAMDEFYDDSVTMQENAGEPTVGLAANIEREKGFLANVKEFHAFDVKSVATGPDLSIVESEMRFTDQSDNEVVLQQVSVQRWSGNRIISERFYYDSGA
ncbi:MAG: SnoaL-like domain-containing protein [Planctomycetota bacterium]